MEPESADAFSGATKMCGHISRCNHYFLSKNTVIPVFAKQLASGLDQGSNFVSLPQTQRSTLNQLDSHNVDRPQPSTHHAQSVGSCYRLTVCTRFRWVERPILTSAITDVQLSRLPSPSQIPEDCSSPDIAVGPSLASPVLSTSGAPSILLKANAIHALLDRQ